MTGGAIGTSVQAHSINGDITIYGHGKLDLLDACRDFVNAAQEYRRYPKYDRWTPAASNSNDLMRREDNALGYEAAWRRVGDYADLLIMFAPDEIVESAQRVAAATRLPPDHEDAHERASTKLCGPQFDQALTSFLEVVRGYAALRGLSGAHAGRAAAES